VFVKCVYAGEDYDYTRISALVLNSAAE